MNMNTPPNSEALPPTTSTTRELAEMIADSLLTNGFGEEGDRLDIRQSLGPNSTFDEERSLGGWCRGAIVDQIVDVLMESWPND